MMYTTEVIQNKLTALSMWTYYSDITIVNLLYMYIHTIHAFVHINHTGRLLQKVGNQYSDFYIQLAAHFLLEVYQETGTVTVMLINHLLITVTHLQTTSVFYGTPKVIMLGLGWKRSRRNAQIQLMLLKIYEDRTI